MIRIVCNTPPSSNPSNPKLTLYPSGPDVTVIIDGVVQKNVERVTWDSGLPGEPTRAVVTFIGAEIEAEVEDPPPTQALALGPAEVVTCYFCKGATNGCPGCWSRLFPKTGKP